MQVGVISDIHDHIGKLEKATAALSGVDVVICCGDLCSPFIVRQLGESFNQDVHIVFGNNDADLFRISGIAAKYPNIHLHGEFCELELDSRKFAINHFDNIGRAIARSDDYDVVCFGHNHKFELSHEGDTLIINPGEIMGGLSGESTCVVYNTHEHSAQRIDL